MARKTKSIADQVRDEVDASGLSLYRISKETGLAESTLSRFMSYQVDIRLVNFEKLLDLFGLELVHTDELVELRKQKRKG